MQLCARDPVGASRCIAWITLICSFCAAPSTGLATKSRNMWTRVICHESVPTISASSRFCLPRLFAPLGEFSVLVSRLIKETLTAVFSLVETESSRENKMQAHSKQVFLLCKVYPNISKLNTWKILAISWKSRRSTVVLRIVISSVL